MTGNLCNAIETLIGGYSSNAIHALYGASQCGKTTFVLQEAYRVSHETGKTSMFYDTEGGGEEFVKAWDKAHKAQYPKAKIIVRTKRNWAKILEDHGYKTMLDVSEKGGKMTVKVTAQTFDTPLGKEIKEKKVGFLFYDSITAPMKFFGSSRENFPARNYAQSMWFQAMLDIIDEHGVVVVANHHATKDPAIPYAMEEMSGGSAVRYFSKVIIYLKKWSAKGAQNYRTLKLARYFDQLPNAKTCMVKLLDDGYHDTNEAEMDEDKKKAK